MKSMNSESVINYELKTTNTRQRLDKNFFLSLIVCLLGITLNQSSVIFGINFSFADLFVILLVSYMIVNNAIVLPRWFIAFSTILSITVLFTASFYVPSVFEVIIDHKSIFVGFIKLIANLIYLIVGANLVRINQEKTIYKSFAYASLFIGALAFFNFIVPLPLINELMLYGNSRFKGLMNDPNYFSVLQNIALAYFVSMKTENQKIKVSATLIIVFSVFMSGSKTGMITTLGVIFLAGLTSFSRKKSTILEYFRGFLLFLILILILLLGNNYFILIIEKVANYIPAFNRISVIFLDFDLALSGGGSGRNRVWEVAVELIKQSPVFGTGVGTYTTITSNKYSMEAIAHNTYLQLAAQWGLPLTIIFFILVFILVIKSFRDKDDFNQVLNRMLIVLLIGSFAISFNNARVFWLVLGSLIYKNVNIRSKKKVEADTQSL